MEWSCYAPTPRRPTPVARSQRSRQCLRSLRGSFLYCEKDVQQIDVYQNGDRHDAVGPRAFHQIQIDQHPGKTKPDDPSIKAHAYPTKRLGIRPSDEIGAERYSNHTTLGINTNKMFSLSAINRPS